MAGTKAATSTMIQATDDPNEAGMQEVQLQQYGKTEKIRFTGRQLVHQQLHNESWQLYRSQSGKFVLARVFDDSKPSAPYEVHVAPKDDLLSILYKHGVSLAERNRKAYWERIWQFINEYGTLRPELVESISVKADARTAAQLGSPKHYWSRRELGSGTDRRPDRFVEWFGWALTGEHLYMPGIPGTALYLLVDGTTYLYWSAAWERQQAHFHDEVTVREVLLSFRPDVSAAAIAKWPPLDQARITDI